jgi:hypothetical protein
MVLKIKSIQLYVKIITSYRTENKLRLHSKYESVKIVYKNNRFWFVRLIRSTLWEKYRGVNPLMPELNPSVQRCLTRLFTGDFASWTVHFINICVKNQQIHQLFIQFINYVW